MRIALVICLFAFVIQVPALAQVQNEIVTSSGVQHMVLQIRSGPVANSDDDVAIYEAMGYRNRRL